MNLKDIDSISDNSLDNLDNAFDDKNINNTKNIKNREDTFQNDLDKFYEDHKKNQTKSSEIQNTNRPISSYQRIVSASSRADETPLNINSLMSRFKSHIENNQLKKSQLFDNLDTYLDLSEFKQVFKNIGFEITKNELSYLFSNCNPNYNEGYIQGRVFINNYKNNVNFDIRPESSSLAYEIIKKSKENNEMLENIEHVYNKTTEGDENKGKENNNEEYDDDSYNNVFDNDNDKNDEESNESSNKKDKNNITQEYKDENNKVNSNKSLNEYQSKVDEGKITIDNNNDNNINENYNSNLENNNKHTHIPNIPNNNKKLNSLNNNNNLTTSQNNNFKQMQSEIFHLLVNEEKKNHDDRQRKLYSAVPFKSNLNENINNNFLYGNINNYNNSLNSNNNAGKKKLAPLTATNRKPNNNFNANNNKIENKTFNNKIRSATLNKHQKQSLTSNNNDADSTNNMLERRPNTSLIPFSNRSKKGIKKTAKQYMIETLQKKEAEEGLIKLALEKRNKEFERDCITKMNEANEICESIKIPLSFSVFISEEVSNKIIIFKYNNIIVIVIKYRMMVCLCVRCLIK